MEQRLDNEPDTIHKLNECDPRMWRYPIDLEYCCIYRVPHRIRRVNPEAYTPQLLLIGPLHHSLKSQDPKSREDITNTKSMGYLNMDKHKKMYLAEFTQRIGGEQTIDGLRRIIKENEDLIRASYLESTSWIPSLDFVDMILHDSVFILEFFLRSTDSGQRPSRTKKTGDLIVDQPCLHTTLREDIILLENQLPYFILEKLFDPILRPKDQTLRRLVINYFGFGDKIRVDSKFKHFTDLLRLVRVETLVGVETKEIKFIYIGGLCCQTKKKFEPSESTEPRNIKHMYNAEKLYSAGVKFVAVKNELSIDVRFENGTLKIPSLWVRDDVEIILRNIIALEQCHYPFGDYVCNYVTFLDFLIDTGKDVDLLMEKGILHSWIGEQNSVAEMVNKLLLGVTECDSCYAEIASRVNAYYENPVNRSRAVLGRKYFGNLWTGTAIVAATLLLVMTLIQTVASIIQVMQK